MATSSLNAAIKEMRLHRGIWWPFTCRGDDWQGFSIGTPCTNAYRARRFQPIHETRIRDSLRRKFTREQVWATQQCVRWPICFIVCETPTKHTTHTMQQPLVLHTGKPSTMQPWARCWCATAEVHTTHSTYSIHLWWWTCFIEKNEIFGREKKFLFLSVQPKSKEVLILVGECVFLGIPHTIIIIITHTPPPR